MTTNRLLTFTNDSPLRTVLLNAQSQPVYRIYSPDKVFIYGSTTTIIRCSGMYPNQPEEEVGRINWHRHHRSQMVFGGRTFEVNSFLQKTGFVGRGNRIWLGPDGQEYMWNVDNSPTTLILNDGSGTVVACFTRGSLRLPWMKQKRPACLQIRPNGFHMVDLILLTFVYAEQKKREHDDDDGGA
ncbi:hypothetical protein JAAARDRAFT_42673 [Jaapia argillacea MUCL 33604]|uniref:DUF6593 domain-containing protein n=1 Tax=Jaapia argillacea MUCL 33604 TaxID=933084 RepID=A0A067P4F9_9AGAM|nr:hypothetical protein JAAARDRAFT_42673 [Jaapia argillacea MUCL 33604]